MNKSLLSGLLALTLIFTACNNPAETMDDTKTVEVVLGVDDLTVGEGPKAAAGDTLSVHYVGTLDDGTQFDSSRDRGSPFEFTLGVGQVIQGWDEGMKGMQVGGMRNLTIPAELGYGARDTGSIPANSTLHFEVELLEIL
jgi:FKBP-type peptidyl-prolyl cis-trans isomerase FkpA